MVLSSRTKVQHLSSPISGKGYHKSRAHLQLKAAKAYNGTSQHVAPGIDMDGHIEHRQHPGKNKGTEISPRPGYWETFRYHTWKVQKTRCGRVRSLRLSEWVEDKEHTKKHEMVDSTIETASQYFPSRRQLLSWPPSPSFIAQRGGIYDTTLTPTPDVPLPIPKPHNA